MEKKVIREIILGIVLLLCALLVLVELNSNLSDKKDKRASSLFLNDGLDSLNSDSLISPKELWDESAPDYLRQEY